MRIFAESYLIGLPFALAGLAIMLASKPLGHFFTSMEKVQSDIVRRSLKPSEKRCPSATPRASRLTQVHNRALVFLCGLIILVAGVLSAVGIVNPYG